MKIEEKIRIAIENSATIEICYTKKDGAISTRQIKDISYSGRGNSFVTAFCLNKNEDRTFTISRISRVRFIDPTITFEEHHFDPNKPIFKLYGNNYD